MFGDRLAREHPAGVVVFAYALCVAAPLLAAMQAAWHWHGSRSAIALLAGIVVGVAVLRAGAQQRFGQTSLWAARVVAFNGFFGALAAIPTVAFVGVSHPNSLLTVTQALADGYIVAMFLGLLMYVKRPSP